MGGFVLRWLFAFLLLAATYNPTDWNFTRWVIASGGDMMSVAVLGSLLLIVGYIIYLRATMRSVGPIGMLLVFGACGRAPLGGVRPWLDELRKPDCQYMDRPCGWIFRVGDRPFLEPCAPPPVRSG